MIRPVLASMLVLFLAASAPPGVPTLPKERGGQDLVGIPLPDLEFDRRIAVVERKEGETPPSRLTLYRWWTNGCPFCRSSLPAMETLRKDFAARGLHVVGVYHPKPPRAVRDDDVRRMANELGFHGDLAVDERWSQLRRVYLDAHPRRATSISLLVDDEGTIRFVHPGPVLFPSEDETHDRENADYVLLREAIEVLLADERPS